MLGPVTLSKDVGGGVAVVVVRGVVDVVVVVDVVDVVECERTPLEEDFTSVEAGKVAVVWDSDIVLVELVVVVDFDAVSLGVDSPVGVDVVVDFVGFAVVFV